MKKSTSSKKPADTQSRAPKRSRKTTNERYIVKTQKGPYPHRNKRRQKSGEKYEHNGTSRRQSTPCFKQGSTAAYQHRVFENITRHETDAVRRTAKKVHGRASLAWNSPASFRWIRAALPPCPPLKPPRLRRPLPGSARATQHTITRRQICPQKTQAAKPPEFLSFRSSRNNVLAIVNCRYRSYSKWISLRSQRFTTTKPAGRKALILFCPNHPRPLSQNHWMGYPNCVESTAPRLRRSTVPALNCNSAWAPAIL